jgi:hypothetical protein
MELGALLAREWPFVGRLDLQSSVDVADAGKD